MATKERLHRLIDELPDTPDTEGRLEAAERELQGDDTAATARGRDFLVSVAHGASGLDLARLRTVRDRAWR
ncbi:MAG: hypothetical protein ACYCUM_10910 [Solirubrobacteraceae bacterium]